MPLPTPQLGEQKSKFIGRCVRKLTSDGEFSSNTQRVAVCNSQWRKKSKRDDMKDETRVLTEDHEMRIDSDGKITGVGIVFDKLSLDLGGFREKVNASAVTRTLQENTDIRSFFNHDPSKVLGRTTAGTLELEVTKRDLRYSIDPPNTTFANDLRESISRGDVSGSSFIFRTVKDEWSEVKGENRRELLDIDLREIGPVTLPAYPQTSVGIRALDDAGIDLDFLRSVIIKIDHKLPISDEERAQLEFYADLFSGFLKGSGQEADTPDAPTRKQKLIEIGRRRLKLIGTAQILER